MSRTPFKTPLPYGTPRRPAQSDSDESTSSMESAASSDTPNQRVVHSNSKLSIVAEFDDLMRFYQNVKNDRDRMECVLADFNYQARELYERYVAASREVQRLQAAMDVKTQECTELDNKLVKARKLVDFVKNDTRDVRRQRDDLLRQVDHIKKVLVIDKDNQSRIPEEMRRKLSFLNDINSEPSYAKLSAINEVNSTGSILSELSYSRSEDELDNSHLISGKGWKKHRPSSGGIAEPAMKKRRSSGGGKAVEINNLDTVRATTTLTVPKEGPITATSVIESIPKPTAIEEANNIINNGMCPSAPPAHMVFESWARGSPLKPERVGKKRPHAFQHKTVVMPESCIVCDKRIRFGKTASKCKECKSVCHLDCKDNLPLPCVPSKNTPNQRNNLGLIGDYTPTNPPMVPAILIHCINEIELRGLEEIGLYRIPGSEKDVKALKEKLLRLKGPPNLNQVEIAVLCGVVKDFMRSLKESIVTFRMRKEFVQAVEAKDPADTQPVLYQLISELPQPNRDTLAYMMVHLQKVSQSTTCKMTAANLAKVLGPTIIGYSSTEPNPAYLMTESMQNYHVMEHLLALPTDYWQEFVDVQTASQPVQMQQTPSTDSLLRSTTTRGMFTPKAHFLKRKQKFFPSPQY